MNEKEKQEFLKAVKWRRFSEYEGKIENKELILEAVKINPLAIICAIDGLIDNDEKLSALKAIYIDIENYRYLSKDLQRDIDILKILVERIDYDILRQIYQEYIDDDSYEMEKAERTLENIDREVLDKLFILKYVTEEPDIFCELDEGWRDDKDVFLQAFKGRNTDPLLQYAGESIKGDKEIVLKVIREEGMFCMCEISDELKADEEVVYEALKYTGRQWDTYWVYDVDEKFWSDRKFVLELVKVDGNLLSEASEELKSDREIVMTAVKQNPHALVYASEELKRDKEIVLEAIRGESSTLKYASDDLKADKEVVLEAVKKKAEDFATPPLVYASEELKNDKEIIMESIKQHSYTLREASEELRGDKEFMLEAVKVEPDLIKYATDELKSDKELLLEILKIKRAYRFILDYIDNDLKKDRDFVLEAVKIDTRVLNWMDKELAKDKEIILEAVRKNGWSLQFASRELKSDREVVIEAVANDEQALRFANKELQEDEEIMLEVILRKAQKKKALKEKSKEAKKLYISYEDELGFDNQSINDEE